MKKILPLAVLIGGLTCALPLGIRADEDMEDPVEFKDNLRSLWRAIQGGGRAAEMNKDLPKEERRKAILSGASREMWKGSERDLERREYIEGMRGSSITENTQKPQEDNKPILLSVERKIRIPKGIFGKEGDMYCSGHFMYSLYEEDGDGRITMADFYGIADTFSEDQEINFALASKVAPNSNVKLVIKNPNLELITEGPSSFLASGSVSIRSIPPHNLEPGQYKGIWFADGREVASRDFTIMPSKNPRQIQRKEGEKTRAEEMYADGCFGFTNYEDDNGDGFEDFAEFSGIGDRFLGDREFNLTLFRPSRIPNSSMKIVVKDQYGSPVFESDACSAGDSTRITKTFCAGELETGEYKAIWYRNETFEASMHFWVLSRDSK